MGATQDVHVELLIMHNTAEEHLSRLTQGQAQPQGLTHAQPPGVTHGPGARCEEQGQGQVVATAVGAAATHSAVPKVEGAEEEDA